MCMWGYRIKKLLSLEQEKKERKEKLEKYKISFNELHPGMKLEAVAKLLLKVVFSELFSSILLNTVILLATGLR